MPRGAAVIPYHGKRGRCSASSTPTRPASRMETSAPSGTAGPEGGRGRAPRAARARRAEGLPRPEPLTFGAYAAPGSRRPGGGGEWKPPRYRVRQLRRSLQDGLRAPPLGASAAGRRRIHPEALTRYHRRHGRPRPYRTPQGAEDSEARGARRLEPADGRERPKIDAAAVADPAAGRSRARRAGVHGRTGPARVPDADADRRPPLRAPGTPLARRRPRRERPPRRRVEERGGRTVDRASPDARRSALAAPARSRSSRATTSCVLPPKRETSRRRGYAAEFRAALKAAGIADTFGRSTTPATRLTNGAAAGRARSSDGPRRPSRWRRQAGTCTWPASCSRTRRARSRRLSGVQLCTRLRAPQPTSPHLCPLRKPERSHTALIDGRAGSDGLDRLGDRRRAGQVDN